MKKSKLFSIFLISAVILTILPAVFAETGGAIETIVPDDNALFTVRGTIPGTGYGGAVTIFVLKGELEESNVSAQWSEADFWAQVHAFRQTTAAADGTYGETFRFDGKEPGDYTAFISAKGGGLPPGVLLCHEAEQTGLYCGSQSSA